MLLQVCQETAYKCEANTNSWVIIKICRLPHAIRENAGC
jgi:hypothetical protein